MDFKIISVMAVIIMANGKPVDEKLSRTLPQAQLPPLSNELSKVLKSHQSSSHMPGTSIMGTSHPAVGQVTHFSSSSQQILSNPVHFTSSKLIGVHKPLQVVMVDNPVTEKFGNVDCNSSSQILVKQQNDPVKSDFSLSKFADIPELENIPSSVSWHQFHSHSHNNFYHVNKNSSQIIPNNFANRHKLGIAEIVDESDERASNDFGLVNEEADDPVLSDFSANKLSSVSYPGPTVASNASADAMSTTESNNVQPASTVMEAAIISNSSNDVTVAAGTIVTSSDTINSLNNSGHGQGEIISSVSMLDENLEPHDSVTNNTKTEKTPPEEKIVSGGLVEEQEFEMGIPQNNSSAQECLSCTEMPSEDTSFPTPSLTKDKPTTDITTNSSDQTQDFTDVSVTFSEQELVVAVGVNSSVSEEGSETHKAHTSLGDISVPAGSSTENRIRGVTHVMQNEPVKEESQFMEDQMLSGGIAVSSTSVNGYEPITVVTAITPTKNIINEKGSYLDDSSNKPSGSKGTSDISISGTSTNSQEPIAIVTAIPYNKETINLAQNTQNKSSNKPSGYQVSSGVSVSTSSVNGHEPVTVVWASKPIIGHFQNQTFGEVSRPADGHISNEHKPLLQVSFPGISVSSGSVNGQKLSTAVTAINPLTQHQVVGGQISLGISVSSSSVKGQKPITTVTAFNPISGIIQNQHTNKPTTSQMPLESLISTSTVNGKKPFITINSPIGGQIQSNLVNVANKPSEMIVSSNIINAKQPVIVTTAINQTTTTVSNLQNKFNNIENKPVSSSSVAQQKPVLMSTSSFMPMGDFAQMPNQFFNRPVGSEMFPSFFGNLGNQPPPTADFFSHITDQLNIPLEQQVNRPIESQTAATSFVSSSSNQGQMPSTITSNSYSQNGQKPVMVVTSLRPASETSIETHNQQTIKSAAIQASSGSSVSSSAFNEQKSEILSNPHSQNRHPSFSGITVSGSSDTEQGHVINAIAVNYTHTQNQTVGERIFSETSTLSVDGQEPVTVDMVSNSTVASQLHNKILSASEKITDSSSSVDGQSQFENVKMKPVDRTPASSGSFTKEKPGITVISDNIPIGDFTHMQNKFFNRPMEGQMFPSSFGGFGNSQYPMTDFFSNIKNQLDITMVNAFEEQQLNKPMGSQLSAENSVSVSNHFINKAKPTTISSSSLSQHGQPSYSGISVSSSLINGQKPVTVVTAFKPDSEVFIETNDQQTNKSTENFVSIGSSASSSSFNGQKPVTTVSNFHSQSGQSAFSGISVSSSSDNKQTAGSGTFIEIHDLQTNKPTANQVSAGNVVSSSTINVQKPVEIVSHPHSHNRPLESQMFPPIFEGLVNQQTNKHTGSQISAGSFISSSSVNGEKPVTVISNVHSQNEQPTFSGISVTSSSVNGQKPITVFTVSKPEPEIFIETHNQHTNKPTGNHVSSGSYVSSSSFNEQKPVFAISSTHSSSYFNEQQPLTVIAVNHTSTTTSHLHSKPNSVTNKTVEGIPVSTTFTTEKEPIMSFTDNFHMGGFNQMQNQLYRPTGSQMFPPLFGGFVNQQINKPTANQALAGSSVTSNSMNVQKPQNGQSSFSGVSVSSGSVNGQKPVVVVSAFKPDSEVFIETNSPHTNKPTGIPVLAGSSASSDFINAQKPITILSNSHLQNGQPAFSEISVSSSSVNSQKPVSVAAAFKPNSEFLIETHSSNSSVNEHKPISIINASNSISSSQGQHPIAVTVGNHIATTTSHLHNNPNSVANRPVSELFVSTSPITEKDSIIISTGNIHIGGYNQMQNQLFNRPMASHMFPQFFGGFVNQQTNTPTGSFVSSNSINGQTPSAIVSNSNSQNKQPTFTGISVSSSSVNGQKPVTVVTALNPDSEVVIKTQNQQIEKPTENQASAENFATSSTITGQKPIMISNNSHSPNGQLSFTGVSVSSSSVNGQKPTTVVTALLPDSEVVLETNNQQTVKPTKTQASASSSTVNGQKPIIISSNFHSLDEEPSFTDISVSNSSDNGKKPVTVMTVLKPDSEVVIEKHKHNEKPTGNQVSISTTSHLHSHPNTIESKPAGFSTTATTEKEPTIISNGNFHQEAFNQMQSQLFNRPMGSQTFPAFFGGFVSQQPPTGFFSHINNQLTNTITNRPAGPQVFVGSSIQSSSSFDGQKSQTTVTSTDSVTGKVTQTKYESVGGKPVAVFQSVSSSVDGEKAQTVLTSKNPITGEVSQTKYVKNLPQELDDVPDSSLTKHLQLEIAASTNVTNKGELQTKFSSSSTDVHNIKEAKIIGGTVTPSFSLDSELGDPNMISTGAKHTSQPGEQNSTEDVLGKNIGAPAIDILKSVGNNSLNEAVGLSVPKEIIAEHTSTEVIGSINPEPPVTTLITSDPSIGAFTQIKYVPHPYHFIKDSDKLFSKKVIINPDESVPHRTASTREISWIKRRYSITDFDKPLKGATFSTSFFNAQSSQPVLSSTNSLTGKIKQRQYTLSGVNVSNVPFRLFFQNWIYPPAEPVRKRVHRRTIQRVV